ncbi:hypothetical protein ACFVVA_06210 [Kitasatospora sp. NPDC058048]
MARGTVDKALDLLRTEGLIVTRTGSAPLGRSGCSRTRRRPSSSR